MPNPTPFRTLFLASFRWVIHAGAGGHLGSTGSHYDWVLTAPVRGWLYRLAFDRGHLDTVIDRFFVGKLQRFADRMRAAEQKWTSRSIVISIEGQND